MTLSEQSVGSTVVSKRHFGVAANVERFASLMVAIALFTIFAFTADVFATSNNVRNILVQIAVVAVVAAGQTVVMLTGGLDLSVGSVVLLSEVVVADLAVRQELPIVVAVGAALGAGALVGLLNGVLIVLVRIEAILVTLGTLLLAAGVAKLLLGLTYIQIDHPFFDRLATSELPGGVPVMVVIMFACYALVAVTLYRTSFGKYVYAVGSNRRAAVVAGLPVNLTQVSAYVVCGAPRRRRRRAQRRPTRARQSQRRFGTGVLVDHGRPRRGSECDRRRCRTRGAHAHRRRDHRHARQLPDDPRCSAQPAAGVDRRASCSSPWSSTGCSGGRHDEAAGSARSQHRRPVAAGGRSPWERSARSRWSTRCG